LVQEVFVGRVGGRINEAAILDPTDASVSKPHSRPCPETAEYVDLIARLKLGYHAADNGRSIPHIQLFRKDIPWLVDLLDRIEGKDIAGKHEDGLAGFMVPGHIDERIITDS
jgi:hypothetical protein